MRGSYSQDLVSSLQNSLGVISPSLITSTSPTRSSSPSLGVSSTNNSNSEDDKISQISRASLISSTLLALETSATKHPLSAEKLNHYLNKVFPQVSVSSHDSSLPSSMEGEGGEGENALLLAKFTIAVIGIVIQELITEAGKLESEDLYWSEVERDSWNTGMFLLQSTPSRIIAVGSLAVSRLRAITTSSLHSTTPSQSLFSLSTYKTALPPSLILTSIFPHLTSNLNLNFSEDQVEDITDFSLSTAKRISRRTRKLLLLPVSPLILTRQEVMKTRSEIKSLRDHLARQIGTLTLSLSTSPYLGNALSGSSIASKLLLSSTWSTIALLEKTLGATTTPSSSSSNPSDFALRLHQLLSLSLPAHLTSFQSFLTLLRRPNYLTRRWPYLISLPLISIVLSRTIYNSRTIIYEWIKTGKETIRGFLIDWVIEPVAKILETVRHGDDASLALMGKESLKSDLESLERMVVDFGRDQYGLKGEQLEELAMKVKVGDLTSVLKVWEEDIKTPLRSAVSGNLIRTLLIQVQKVKVDVALAMDGIEKMLRSQQLTFGFVGVAPSMIILVALSQWVRSIFSRDGSKKNLKDIRLRNWSTMRHLDAILSPKVSTSSSTPKEDSTSITQGYLLLELHSLRTYAQSRYFPTNNTQLKEAFLDDVRELENSGTEADAVVRRVLIERLWRWSTALKWVEIL